MSYEVSKKVKDTVAKIVSMDSVQNGITFIEADAKQTIENQLELVVLQAPTGGEGKRAKRLLDFFSELGLVDCHIDEFGNAIGIRPGKDSSKKIVIEAHMDTVFPLGTVIEPKTEDGKIYAPGINDDTRGLVVLLSTLRALNYAKIKTEYDLLFMGTAREEGMGGLGGMRDFMSTATDILGCICVDGPAIPGIVYEATGFKTYEANFYGKGGHASGAFGKVANPINAAARAVAKISNLQVPENPRTIFCVSNFHAGNDAGIHAIVPQATIKYNIRSDSAEILEKLDRTIHAILAEACFEETARWGMDTITHDYKLLCAGPAGTQCDHTPIVEADYEVIKYLGAEPIFMHGGSTNANIPISTGIPAVCTGMGGENTKSHTLDEFFIIENAHKGVQQVFLLGLAVAGIDGESQSILK